MVRCDECGKNFFVLKLHEEVVPSRFPSAAPCDSQVSSEMFSCEQNSIPNQQVQYINLLTTGSYIDTEQSVRATQTDEHLTCAHELNDDWEGNCPRTKSKTTQLSAIIQINSLAPGVNKDTTGGVVPYPNFVRTQNVRREDASTMLNAAECSSLQRSGKRKQSDDTNNSQSMDSCSSKRQWKYDSLSNVSSSDDKICSENVVAAVVDSQSAEHPLGEVNIPEEGNTTYEDSEIYDKELTDIATQSSDNSMIACSCPEIFDFENLRDANMFALGQIWALYDKLDVMPRFYAQIRHINVSNFKIHFSWLEHRPMNEEEEKWTDKKLPVACGNFFLQTTIYSSKDRFTFSHVVAWTKGKERNTYKIYPNKGEVWAVYKGWSMQ